MEDSPISSIELYVRAFHGQVIISAGSTANECSQHADAISGWEARLCTIIIMALRHMLIVKGE